MTDDIGVTRDMGVMGCCSLIDFRRVGTRHCRVIHGAFAVFPLWLAVPFKAPADGLSRWSPGDGVEE